MIRAPICTVVGHVDHGKTTLLDAIRGTAVTAGEAGAITQAIGASIIPIEHIVERAKGALPQKITIPGLLFIDTPGHAAFTGMRKRGGSLADIAVLIVDVNEGFKPQTREALEILKTYRTPFVVAANKIDLSPGYQKKSEQVLKDIEQQNPRTNEHIETKLYELVGVLHEYGFPADRFDRLESFERQVAIVPISAKDHTGIDSLLAIIVGLAQRYLEKQLSADADGPAKGTILEVSEEQGLGLTLNAIIYDGTLDVGDTVVIGTLGEPIVTRVRALLQPSDVGDIRDRKTAFRNVKEAVAATGVKIVAPNLEGAAAGMPVIEVTGSVEDVKKEVSKEVQSVTIETDEEGVVVKADNIGSLEALISLLREKDVPIRSASVGPVNKKDLTVAASNTREHAVVLGFNIPEPKGVPEGVSVFVKDIIYALIDDYEQYTSSLVEKEKTEELERLARVAKLEVLPGCIFRASNPLICGVRVVAGRLKQGAPLFNPKQGLTTLANVKEIQDKKVSLPFVETGAEVAISVPGAVGGRNVHEGDVLWTKVDEEGFRKLRSFAKQLSSQEIAVLKEYAELMRENNPLWGV